MTEQLNDSNGFWGILELMGHRRLAGFISERTFGGGAFVQIEIPDPVLVGAWIGSSMYGAASVYGIHPVDETTARQLARAWQARPVSKWELSRVDADHRQLALEEEETEERQAYDEELTEPEEPMEHAW